MDEQKKNSVKKVSAVRTALWSSLGIENVLVVGLILMKTQPEFYMPSSLPETPEGMSEALNKLRVVLAVPWILLANGLGVSLRTGLLWRSTRKRHYLLMTYVFAVLGVAGYFLTDYGMKGYRWESYPEVFDNQVMEGMNCRSADILLDWGKEGCAFALGRLDIESDADKRKAIVSYLGHVPCEGREEKLWEIMEDVNEPFLVCVEAAAALDWMSEGRLEPKIQEKIEEIGKTYQIEFFKGLIDRNIHFNQNARKKPKELHEFLFPSACNRIVSDEALANALGEEKPEESVPTEPPE